MEEDSNKILNFFIFFILWSQYRDLNSGPFPYQGNALPLSYIGNCRAGDGGRTRDIQLGRLTLYQLSYSRINLWGEQDSNLRS